ncbi:two-component system, unclassified family, sensor histidine kinase and response regulator [Aromatoleum tolulyticum]|uniref:Sensory/regulatory protein RpfC n=1 Tax=Aromatoleum tolulyticum TaxID=34027 RepID=A0A1N6SZ58_9RHOO|nr:response regulator [Aromatoleum tolulyticum]SIQ46389.1 two-component system, unclassified family, sensor histidine kinase and response regulator [Aromatoleum tolulyticum]
MTRDSVGIGSPAGEARFHMLFEDARHAIVLVEDGRFVAANRAALDLLRLDNLDRLLGRTLADISPPLQPDGRSSTTLAEETSRRALADGGGRFEWEHVRGDGTLVEVDVLVTVIHDGERALLHSVLTDVTAQKQAQRELADYRERLEALVAERTAELAAVSASLREANAEQQAILDTATSGIALIKDRVLVRCNRRLHEMFGWPPGGLVGQRTAVWYPDEAAHKAGGDPVYAAIWRGESHRREQQLMRRDGSLFWARLTGTAVDPSDRSKGSVWVVDDISAEFDAIERMQKARALAEDAARIKSDFLANMSHEIRTPMNAIIGMTYLALRTQLDARQRDYLEKILGSSQHLLGIINDVLDFSKIEAGKLVIERIDFDLEKTVADVGAQIVEKTNAKGLELVIDVAADVPASLVGDPLRISQILLNYANNAVKFTERGEIVMRIRREQFVDGEVVLRFEVRDTGIGIDDELRDRLFRSFEQADTSTTRKYGGTGLGLAISKRLAGMMGGSVGVDSQPGAGSTFWFTCRLGIGRCEGHLLMPAPDLRGLRALIADDNLSSREVLAEMMRCMTFRVHAVDCGRAAVVEVERAAHAGEPYDIVLLDWQMPELDGVLAARAIGLLGLPRLPVRIVVTAYGREDVARAAVGAGVDDILLKPVTASALFDTAIRLLDGALRPPRPHAAAGEAPADLAAIRGARLLLVEDNELNQEVASELLGAAGLRVDIAGNGAEAVQRVQQAAYDLVLMDMQMPVMDGVTATRAIRRLPACADLPIVAMTANAMAGDREQCIEAGMNDHIAKPIQPDRLWAALLRWISPRGAADGAAGTSGAPAAPSAAPRAILARLRRVPGLDPDLGVRRLMGKEDFYLSLLRKFVTGYGDFTARLDAALAGGDLAAAERLAHSLKGLAGQIGATVLQEVAAELERNLHAGCPAADIDEARDRAARALADLIEALSQALPASAPAL